MLAERGVALEVIAAGPCRRAHHSGLRGLIERPRPGALLETGDEHAAARTEQAALGELLAQAQ